ncbi:hypothetical protein F5X99DRAFT_412230 [Biscogniauxia marginata]|nr:hypothetical protein F5X99DRAFT_412230 [Biscogniauxia marginata]
MARTLPWKRNEHKPTNAITKSSRSGSSRSHENVDHASDAEGEGAKASSTARGKRARKSILRSNRSASTSPPPEPLQENFMIEGPDDDDQYRMVEDELLATAQRFTAHLHAAEYQRLKAASRSENAAAIKDISRPVVGRMTGLVKKKQERNARLERQKLATRKVLANKGRDGDSSDGDGSPWRASLYGLMESPRKKATSLDGLVAAKTATRAAAGFTSSKPRGSTDKLPGSRPRQEHVTSEDVLDFGQKLTSHSIRATSSSGTEQSYLVDKRNKKSLHVPSEATEANSNPTKATEKSESGKQSEGAAASNARAQAK